MRTDKMTDQHYHIDAHPDIGEEEGGDEARAALSDYKKALKEVGEM